MPKVLIIGPRFYYFNESIERAFSALGFDTRILTFDNPVHPYNLINKIRYKLTKDKLGMKRESRQQWQPEADRAFSQYAPDIVFVMNGNMLLPETLKRWRQKGAKVVGYTANRKRKLKRKKEPRKVLNHKIGIGSLFRLL